MYALNISVPSPTSASCAAQMAQTAQRVYWANKATAITADLPSEAELTPRLWGSVRGLAE